MEIKRKISNTPKLQARGIPLTMKWNNEPMIRIHSIRAAVREILALNQKWDLVRVNAIGTPSTGKTELSYTCAHLAHELGKIDYTVKKMTRKELLNFDLTIKRLEPKNYFMIIDDISFLKSGASNAKLLQVQKDSTEIRHLEGGIDIKIILWFNFHYYKSVPPYLRQAEYYFYTTVGHSEKKAILETIGNNENILNNFTRTYKQAITHPDGNYEFTLSKSKGKKPFVYHYRKPFAPVLFYNGIFPRIVVFPSRKWIAPICPNCDMASMNELDYEMNMSEFDLDFSRFGDAIIKEALKVVLYNAGVSTYKKRVIQCMKALSRYFDTHPINPQQLALAYGLIPKPKAVNGTRHINPKDTDKK